jgi:hypothetical protein
MKSDSAILASLKIRLEPQEGIAKLKQQASWLEREYPDVAAACVKA